MHHHTFNSSSGHDGLDNDSFAHGTLHHHDGHDGHDSHGHAPASRGSEDEDDQTRGTSGTTSFTGDIYIDGILWGGSYVDAEPITYSFWDDPELDNDFWDIASPDNRAVTSAGGRPYVWNKQTKDSMELALKQWSNVANIEFEKNTDDDADADFGFLLVGNREFGGEEILGLFGPPDTYGAGIGYFNYDAASWDDDGLPQGSMGFATLIHELGHGLGLAHPHDNGGDSPKYPGVVDSSDTGRNALNQGVYTTMSYNDGLNGNVSLSYGNQGTPMAFDIAAIQHLYGANMTYNSGDTTYRVPGQNQVGTYYSSIWDGGGTDTISAQGVSANTTINLNEAPLVGANAGGYLSKAEGIDGGFTIANNVTIENAIGGTGDDVIVGNDADNTLDGNGGADVLLGQDGDDMLLGMAGADVLNGGFGDDRLKGGKDRDELYGEKDSDRLYGGQDRDKLYGGQQSDRLYGEQDRDKLYGGQDDDVLDGGQGRDQLFGGQGGDRLSGGADNDYLEGGGGDDVLFGNGGADLFVVAPGKGTDVIKDFAPSQDSLGLGSGLSVSDVTIVPLQNRVAIEAGGDRLALLIGVDASQLTDDVFQLI